MFDRLKRSLLSWPDANGWTQCFLTGALSLLLIGIVAGFGGLLAWQPRFDGWPLRLISVICVPAFTEELVFRGLLIPGKGEMRRPMLWSALAVLAFVPGIYSRRWFFFRARRFFSARSSCCAQAFWAGCALMRYRTGSIWPAVILHGLLVWVWQVFFGGPDITQLLR